MARLTAPDSWLSLVGRVPIDQGEHRVGGASDSDIVLPTPSAPANIGRLVVRDTQVHFTPNADAHVSLLARDHKETQSLAPGVTVALRTDHDGAPDKLVIGTLTLEVAAHASGMFVRMRDPESATRREFAGIDHYAIDPKWRVVAKLDRYDPPKPVELGYETGATQHYTSPGMAVFEIDGVTHRVEPVFDGDRPRLYLVFWDPTARDTTYGAGRFLYAPLPAGDRVLLDFNQAFSPPCAFTPFAACPLAPTQNRLSARVEAGEKSAH